MRNVNKNIKITVLPEVYTNLTANNLQSYILFRTVKVSLNYCLNFLKFLLPSLLDFNKFFLHLNLELIFHLINMSLKLQYFLFHTILPSKLSNIILLSLIFNHRKNFLLKLFYFSHHFLLFVIVNLSPLGNKITDVVFITRQSAFTWVWIIYISFFSFSILRRITSLN